MDFRNGSLAIKKKQKDPIKNITIIINQNERLYFYSIDKFKKSYDNEEKRYNNSHLLKI
jgi:hypothetical protein